MSRHLVLRSFTVESDYLTLAEILNASQNADGLPLCISPDELAKRLINNPQFDIYKDLVIAEMNNYKVGYGRVQRQEESSRLSYNLTGFVRPEWRRKGIGSQLLTWLEERAQSMAEEHPTSFPRFCQINATQYQPGLHALVKQASYQIKESWVLMIRRSLEDIPDISLPAGLEARPAQPENYPAIWYAVEQAYAPEGGPPPAGDIPENFKNDPNFQPDLWQVAWEVDTGKVVGSVMAYVNHSENKNLGIMRGYTEGISTIPAWRRRGVATALIYQSLKSQRALGLKESALVCSGEKPENYKLYQSCGFQESKRDTVYEKLLID